MGSGIDSPSGLDSTSSLELALDQAIARRFSGVHDRGGKKRRNTPPQNFAVVAASKPELVHTPTENLRGRPTTALAVTANESSLMRPPARLCWKGIEVSHEFQAYAARVERGEQLAPYRGPVLSRPCAEFPWGAAPRERQMLPPGRSSLPPQHDALSAQRSSLAPMAVPMIDLPAPDRPLYPERGRALKTGLWLVGAVSSIVAALGVGAGATSTPGNEFDERASERGRAPEQAAAATRGAPVTSALDAPSPLGPSIGERQLDSLAAANAEARPGAVLGARSLIPAPIATRPTPAAAATRGASPTRSSAIAPGLRAPAASRLSIPPATSAAAGVLGHGGVTSARPIVASDGASSSSEGSLFSERPSF